RASADLYYVRVVASHDPVAAGDSLFYATEGDIAEDDEGLPVREYTYERPGFFSDEALTQRASVTVSVDGDEEHEKVRIERGDVLYAAGDDDAVYRIDVGEKPSRARISLTVTR